MKRAHFCKPGSIFIEYQQHREGPSPVYIAWKPHTAKSFTDTKALLKFCGWPKSTPTGVELRAWLDTFKDIPIVESKDHAARIKKEGFGPEAHDDADPTTNTKTII